MELIGEDLEDDFATVLEDLLLDLGEYLASWAEFERLYGE